MVLQKEAAELYRTMPEGFEPGTLYTTPDALAKSGLTRYGLEGIRHLIKSPNFPGVVKIGRQFILSEAAVEAILDRDQKKASGELIHSGVKPGATLAKRGRKRLGKTSFLNNQLLA